MLLAMSEELGKFVPYVGGPSFGHTLLQPLEQLSQVEETVVRDKAVESLCKVAEQLPNSSIGEHFLPLIKVRLAASTDSRTRQLIWEWRRSSRRLRIAALFGTGALQHMRCSVCYCMLWSTADAAVMLQLSCRLYVCSVYISLQSALVSASHPALLNGPHRDRPNRSVFHVTKTLPTHTRALHSLSAAAVPRRVVHLPRVSMWSLCSCVHAFDSSTADRAAAALHAALP